MVIPVPQDDVMNESSAIALKRLVGVVFNHGDERTKARAMLCHIHHTALHEYVYTARDLMLMSHLQVGCSLLFQRLAYCRSSCSAVGRVALCGSS
jgi:translation initiation factor 3 subunit C